MQTGLGLGLSQKQCPYARLVPSDTRSRRAVMIQLTRSGAVVDATPGQIETLQQQFAEHHFILLPHLVSYDVLNILLEQIQAAQFVPRDDAGIAHESWLPDGVAKGTLTFLMSSPGFLAFIEQVTGRKSIAVPSGRIYRFAPLEQHHDDWHNDIIPGQNRVLAFSINLSPVPFEGGELVIRESKSKTVLAEIANTGLGNAVIFRVDQNLEHRVSQVQGNNPRTAFAGWFCELEGFHENIKKYAQASAFDPMPSH